MSVSVSKNPRTKMKKKKGKVHPSPSPSPSPLDMEAMVSSVLSVLPVAILAMASVLSFEDREVLAYMIKWSNNNNNKKKKRHSLSDRSNNTAQTFGCECFECYTAYWVRWDSSPNRHLIDRVIDAFEDHIASRPNKSPDDAVSHDLTRLLPSPAPEITESPAVAPAASEHRGLARKVLPDVLGLLNSRLWRLWNPNA